ncbi:arsenite efflux transporter metallochaperone ArsD [Salmonella enterica]|nr:arsenite efflux transporter metallochaperone ArsD [Salmonella enterica]EJX2432101.1 arsenite efflux transporter metallochaperone ArsD [Salmonella enterica]EJX3551784.1 arsenite efflux transporter metallochaperone ArsD [Salmonella enterica]
MNTIHLFTAYTDSDPAQAVWATDMHWAQQQGMNVARSDITEIPTLVAENTVLMQFLQQGGAEVLPVTLVNNELVMAGRYPSRSDLMRWSEHLLFTGGTQPATLSVTWQRLLNSEGETCPRCQDTGESVLRAITRLRDILAPLGITPRLEPLTLDETTFAAASSESNRIWFAGIPLEEWIGAQAGSSRCCGACGDNDCRTLEIDGATWEAIPEVLLVRAGVIAAIQLINASKTVNKDIFMKTIHIYDPALCCSSGVCGPETDPALVAFAADFEWAKTQGASIERFNLAQQPLLFSQNETVKGFLTRSGKESLPLILVDGEVALAGRYPRREELSRWLGLTVYSGFTPMASPCCGGDKCC